MRIIEFIKEFPDEDSCKRHFKRIREEQGIKCRKCSCIKQYWLKAKWQWQCSNCGFRTGLRSGTIMHGTKISFQKFYLCMAFMTSTKKGISAKEMQKQLGHKRYTTIWRLMHRIRSAMGQREDKYDLSGFMEFDEGYFTTTKTKGKALKRGRGSNRKQNVAVIAESTPLEYLDLHKKSSHFRYAKMKVVKGQGAKQVNRVVKNAIDNQSILITDKSTSYKDFSKLFDAHLTYKSSKEVTKHTLKWVHIIISNAKRNLLGVYHMMSKEYLQNYLDEFIFKLNRRFMGEKLFDRVIIATVYAKK